MGQSAVERPLVSIVTPSYNQGRFLAATIESVLAQDYPNVEYIVVDGGSSDDSLAIIERYAGRLAGWISEPDRGQAHAINKGLHRATGAILGWLNSDDLLRPDAVSRAVAALAAEPGVDVVYGRLARIDSQGRPVPTPLLPKDRLEFGPRHAIGECIVNQPGSFWRRSIMERAGRLDEGLHYALDYELWVRMLLAGGTFRRLPAVVADFRLSEGSKTVGQTAVAAQEHLQVIDRFLAQPDLAAQLGISRAELARQARRGRALVSLYVFYGLLKKPGGRRPALQWLRRAVGYDPQVLADRRWLDLAGAGARRRLAAWRRGGP